MHALAPLILAVGIASQPPVAPPQWETLHGVAYFEHDSTERVMPAGPDPILLLARRVPPDAYVLVRGKADALGDEGYNDRLSLRRARVIADTLVAEGVRPEQIMLAACGERDLNRPQADGASEPLNRTADFDWRMDGWPPSSLCLQAPYVSDPA